MQKSSRQQTLLHEAAALQALQTLMENELDDGLSFCPCDAMSTFKSQFKFFINTWLAEIS